MMKFAMKKWKARPLSESAMVPYCLAVVCGGLLVGFLVERCLLAMEVMGKGR